MATCQSSIINHQSSSIIINSQVNSTTQSILSHSWVARTPFLHTPISRESINSCVPLHCFCISMNPNWKSCVYVSKNVLLNRTPNWCRLDSLWRSSLWSLKVLELILILILILELGSIGWFIFLFIHSLLFSSLRLRRSHCPSTQQRSSKPNQFTLWSTLPSSHLFSR